MVAPPDVGVGSSGGTGWGCDTPLPCPGRAPRTRASPRGLPGQRRSSPQRTHDAPPPPPPPPRRARAPPPPPPPRPPRPRGRGGGGGGVFAVVQPLRAAA